MRSAVQRYPPNEHTLTAVHSDLVQVRISELLFVLNGISCSYVWLLSV